MNELKGQLEIRFEDEMTFNNDKISYAISEDGRFYLNVEQCAKAIGVSKTSTLKSGKVSTTPRWDRVYDDLIKIDAIPNVGNYKDMNKNQRNELRKRLSSMLIEEKDFYLWCFTAGEEKAKEFKNWVAGTVLPNLRQHGVYLDGMEHMTAEEIRRYGRMRLEKYIIRKLGIGVRRSLTDAIQSEMDSPDRVIYAKYTNLLYNVIFNMDAKDLKLKYGLRKNDHLRNILNEDELDIIAKGEDFMANLMSAGMTDYKMLKSMMVNWWNTMKKKQNILIG